MSSRIYSFYELCEASNLLALIEYVELHHITAEDARSDDNYAFRRTCSNGHLHVAQWIIERFGLTKEDTRFHAKQEIIDQLNWEPSLGPKSAVKLT